jgi:hypothetical protein
MEVEGPGGERLRWVFNKAYEGVHRFSSSSLNNNKSRKVSNLLMHTVCGRAHTGRADYVPIRTKIT